LVEGSRQGVAGGDAHKHSLTFAVIDSTGVPVAVATFNNDLAGLAELVSWLNGLGVNVLRIGIEGANGWGRHATSALTAAGFDVREVPAVRTAERRRRRRRPKTDREDALAIAAEVLADAGLPPALAARSLPDAQAELAVICERRRALVRRRQRLLNEAEGGFNKLPLEVQAVIPRRATVAARLRALTSATIPTPHDRGAAELLAWLREMAADLAAWDRRIAELEARLPALLAACGSTLTAEFGIGVISAAELVAQVGDPTRFPTESAFARWCGVAPVATSSGEGDQPATRHRLDLLGNRAVNRILYVMSVTQARHQAEAQQFLARKQTEGKSKKEARRAHKRQLANRIIRRMWADHRRLTAAKPPQDSALDRVA
jgi:transposase